MEILSIFLISIISLLGLPVGFILAKIAKEELVQGENYFIWMQNIILILIINLFFYSHSPRIRTLVIIFAITSFLIIKYEPRALIGYFICGILCFLGIDNPALIFIIASLIFLYGLPTAALIRIEGIKAEAQPLRYIEKKTWIIGHRGAPHYCPENTITSYKKAIELGADMIEVDVRSTKDNKLILMHDPNVNRMTNGKGYVKDMHFKDIKKLTVRGKEKIPTLQEAINLVKGRRLLNVHIKEHEDTDKVIRLIKKNKMQRKVLISSFSENTLKRVKELDKKIKTAYLFSKPTPFYIETAKKLGVFALHPHYSIITKRVIKRAHKNRLKVNVWSVKSKSAVFKSKFYYGVDGLIIDDPLLFEKQKTIIERTKIGKLITI
jgi:glycerophosphoryl diester phosphodiesterase